MDHFDDIGPSVVMASPGMMQSGLSRELFESWCTDKRNGVIIAGYSVEGTLAKVGLGLQPFLRHFSVTPSHHNQRNPTVGSYCKPSFVVIKYFFSVIK